MLAARRARRRQRVERRVREQPREYVLLPSLCVGSDGAVESVQLVTQLPLPAVQSIAVTSASATSVALVRMLFPHAEIRSEGAEADARLLIGDEALSSAFSDPTPHHDLGALWRERTGLPMVFAVWAARRDCDPERSTASTAPCAAPSPRPPSTPTWSRRPPASGTASRPATSPATSRSSATASASASAPACSASTRSPPSAARSRACPSCASPRPLAYADADGSRRRHPARAGDSRAGARGRPARGRRRRDAAALARPGLGRARRRRDAHAQDRPGRGHVHRRPEHQLHERLHHGLRLLRLLPAPGRHARGLRPAEAGHPQEDRGDARARRHRRADAGRPPPRPRDRVVRGPVPLASSRATRSTCTPSRRPRSSTSRGARS